MSPPARLRCLRGPQDGVARATHHQETVPDPSHAQASLSRYDPVHSLGTACSPPKGFMACFLPAWSHANHHCERCSANLISSALSAGIGCGDGVVNGSSSSPIAVSP